MPSKKELKKNQITTDLGKKLHNYNGEPSAEFGLVTESADAMKQFKIDSKPTPGYLGGANPLGKYVDYDSESYDGDLREHHLDDLDEIRSKNQGVLNSLGNSLANLVGKTAVNVVGGLTGAMYGGVKAIADGDISSLWDNDLFTALDNTSDAIGEAFKVYKSADYNDKFILNKMVSNPLMFADEFMDTLSFTTGAVITELISGGLASAAVGARASKYLNTLFKASNKLDGLADASKIAGALNAAGNTNKLITGLEKSARLTRQLATGAFWEGSVEARHLGKEMKDNMVKDYIEEMAKQGVTVDPENLPKNIDDDINDRVENASLATLGLNMALVGYSNLSQFPSVFKSFGNTRKIASEGVTSDIIDGVRQYSTKASKLAKNQRALNKVWAGVKNPFMEGFVEEGGQGVISGTMGSFFDRKNDVEGITASEQFLNSFGKSILDTYTTKEGLNEVLMGALIGGVGAPGRGLLSVLGKDNALGRYGYEKSIGEDNKPVYKRASLWDGGAVGGIDEYNSDIQQAEELATLLNDSPDILKALKVNFDAQVRSNSLNKNLDEAIDNNDHFEFANAKDDILFNYIDSRAENGLLDDVYSRLEDLENMDLDQFFTAFKGEDASNKATTKDKEFFKKTQLDSFKSNIELIANARNTVDSFLEGTNFSNENFEAVKTDLTYYLSKAGMLSTREKAINDKLAKISNNTIIPTTSQGNTLSEAIKSLSERIKDAPTLELKKRLAILKAYHKKHGDNFKSPFISSLMSFAENNPTEYAANKKDLELMLKDIKKINLSKNTFLKLFNTLNNTRELIKYSDFLDKLKEGHQNALSQMEESAEVVEPENVIYGNINQVVEETPVANIEPVSMDNTPEIVEEEIEGVIEEEKPVTERPAQTSNDKKSNVTGENPFSFYEESDSNLLSKLLEKLPAFLRGKLDVQNREKNIYVKYRASSPNLPVVGSAEDISKYKEFYSTYTEDSVDEAPQATGIDNIENFNANFSDPNYNPTSAVRRGVKINRYYSFKTDSNGRIIFISNKTGKEVTNTKVKSNIASILYKNNAVFNYLLDNLLESESETLQNFVDKAERVFKENTFNEDTEISSPELEVMSMLIGVKFKPNGIVNNLSDVGAWVSKNEKYDSLDSFITNHLYPLRDSIGLSSMDEQGLTNFVLDIISKYPKGIRAKDIKQLESDLNPAKPLLDLQAEFLERIGLNIEEVFNTLKQDENEQDIIEEQAFVDGFNEGFTQGEEKTAEQLAQENDTKISQNEELIERQVANPDGIGDTPIGIGITTANSDVVEPYLGNSLTNIHNKRSNSGGVPFNVRDDSGKLVLLSTYPKDALLPNIALAGSQITVSIASESEYIKYSGKNDYNEVISNPETIPVVAKQNGKFIGFILTPKGAQTSSKGKISKDNLYALKSLRNNLYNNQGASYVLNVQDKSNGVVMYRKDSNNKPIYRPISEHLSVNGNELADGVKIVTDINGVLHGHDGVTFTGDVINPSIQSGKVFAVLPLPNGKFVKVPLNLSRIGENDANTVFEIIKYFAANDKYAPDKDIVAKRNDFRNRTGINLGNIKEFYMNVKNILFINDMGQNQFFTKVKQPDGTYNYVFKSPDGKHAMAIRQSDIYHPNAQKHIVPFITKHFYRGFNVNMMNAGNYQHINVDVNGNLSGTRYINYADYALKNNILESDVYGERVDTHSNKMFFAIAPFIKIDYNPTGQTVSESSEIEEVADRVIEIEDQQVNFIDELDIDDIDFSLGDLKYDADEIISSNIEDEIDNFIKICK